MSYGARVVAFMDKKKGWCKKTIFMCHKCQFRTISINKIINHMKNGHPIPLDQFLGE